MLLASTQFRGSLVTSGRFGLAPDRFHVVQYVECRLHLAPGWVWRLFPV